MLLVLLTFRDCNCRHHACMEHPCQNGATRVYLFTNEMSTLAFVSQNILENTVRTIVSHLILALSIAKVNNNKNIYTFNFRGKNAL